MKYVVFIISLFLTFHSYAETLHGKVAQIRNNVVYLQTSDRKKIPLITDKNTIYQKVKILNKSKININPTEIYLPLIQKNDQVQVTYYPDTSANQNSAITASKITVITD